MNEVLRSKLEARKQENSFRQLTLLKGEIDFFSNDYLGLSKESIPESVSHAGSTGSRLLSGNSNEALEAEKSLAKFFESECALVFNSGYTANLGVMSCLPQRGDYILYDELVHASIRDGIRLSNAKAISFKHNDPADLEKQIAKVSGTIYIVVESLYSMDGDMAPLRKIIEISRKNAAFLIVDEAHAVGVFGWEGRGIVHGREIIEDVFARIITFGKAFGFHGAAVLGSSELISYLVNFARSFIYTTALPPSDYQLIMHRIEREDIRERQLKLHDNLTYFRSKLNLPTKSEINSPIQVFQFDSKEAVVEISKKLINQGIYTKPIFSPTVPKGEERIRLCFHSYNTKEEIDLLLHVLNDSKF
ncbi:MAG: aminotransferase class I/II-fold pyridoxal phosphate-dependent enzyme [Crocinitomicaceae bacterium]|jgi:8-amino-7-oxononanoate synthase